MNDIFSLGKLGGDFSFFAEAVKKKNVSVYSLSAGSKAHLAAALGGFVLYVAPDRLAAKSAVDRINSFGRKFVYIPEKDDVLLHRRAFSPDNVYARLAALTAVLRGEADGAVVSAEGIFQLFPLAERLNSACSAFSVGQEYEPSAVVAKLSSAGYTVADSVHKKGDAAHRGDIVDVFPVNANSPVRLSFFDVQLEEIREFDPETGVSHDSIKSVFVAPASDILPSEREAEKAVAALSALNAYGRLGEIVADVDFKIKLNRNDCSLVWVAPFERSAFGSVFGYLPRDAVVIFDEPVLVSEKIRLYTEEHVNRVKSLISAGEATEAHYRALLTESELSQAWKEFRLVSFGQMLTQNPIFEPRALFDIKSQAVTKYYLDNDSLVNDMHGVVHTDKRAVLCCDKPERAAAIAKSLSDEGVFVSTGEAFDGKSRILVSTMSVKTGFVYPSAKLVVIGTDELVGRSGTTKVIRQKKDFIAPKIGDYVVHRVHGIGICTGTIRHKIDEIEKDFIVLQYKDGDTLYVATDQMDNLEKYTGVGVPTLSKIGGKEFAKAKEKVKKSVRKLALDLLKIYAERENSEGYVYPPDSELQREFEANFEFTETQDQLDAVAKIKEEMERGKIVDRLVCGDVGFGKTEVAMRAVFKTILENKQAALLAPTTILARQHYETLKKRMEPFGADCEILTRFQTKAEIAASLERLASGRSLVAVATHRMLSKDVVFSDLGLLVLDEEQRFGVEHKEKLREKYAKLNVITLSATPIPRTLNMALSGIRDISLLETPPVGRLPIQTYIAEYSDGLVKDAITRELARGGQVFVLYNRVETIDSYAADLQRLLGGEVRIIVGHGQLPKEALEKRMAEFYAGEADVLVASTIIENGIDLPSANTLIVCEADRFGLSQLYQLRGRVGRSETLAHAYFTTAPGKVISGDATERLVSLLDNTELGSGFKIAMRDLELRGAGDLLGAEQHGHIEKVGYLTYVRLLNEAVRELKGEAPLSSNDVKLFVDANAYIRDDYVSSSDKLKIYKQIAEVATFSQRNELLSELSDIYGAPGQPLVNLVDIALLKNLAGRLGAEKVTVNRAGAAICFNAEKLWQSQDILAAAAELKNDVVLTDTIPPQLTFNVKGLTAEQKIAKLLGFLQYVLRGARS